MKRWIRSSPLGIESLPALDLEETVDAALLESGRELVPLGASTSSGGASPIEAGPAMTSPATRSRRASAYAATVCAPIEWPTSSDRPLAGVAIYHRAEVGGQRSYPYPSPSGAGSTAVPARVEGRDRVALARQRPEPCRT